MDTSGVYVLSAVSRDRMLSQDIEIRLPGDRPGTRSLKIHLPPGASLLLRGLRRSLLALTVRAKGFTVSLSHYCIGFSVPPGVVGVSTLQLTRDVSHMCPIWYAAHFYLTG